MKQIIESSCQVVAGTNKSYLSDSFFKSPDALSLMPVEGHGYKSLNAQSQSLGVYYGLITPDHPFLFQSTDAFQNCGLSQSKFSSKLRMFYPGICL